MSTSGAVRPAWIENAETGMRSAWLEDVRTGKKHLVRIEDITGRMWVDGEEVWRAEELHKPEMFRGPAVEER